VIKKLFAIPSLLAAGLFAASPSSAEDVLPRTTTLADHISEIVSSITDSHEYTLAGHSSHGSHGSHGSHRSHRSGYYQPDPPAETFRSDAVGISSDLIGTRNYNSTPPKSVLPSSFGTVRKIKVLPGNSEKFKNILLRVQLKLDSLGYDIGAMGTNLDAKTVSAIYKFQKDRGMIPSGRITHEVLGALQIIAQ
jgi:His-Xaa-Ser repeat protein HxsA